MAKLYFRYGAMGSSKTANALMVQYNYQEKGQIAILMKPEIDTRDGKNIIKSRIGLESKSIIMPKHTSIYDIIRDYQEQNNVPVIHAIVIDEAQFLTKVQVNQLCVIVDKWDIPVICYGLRTDFKGELFEGSQWLLAWADTIEEIKTICWCGKKATMNLRTQNGKPVFYGAQILLGGNESYIAVCRKHWKTGKTQN
jgi:thymidine kinase